MDIFYNSYELLVIINPNIPIMQYDFGLIFYSAYKTREVFISFFCIEGEKTHRIVEKQ